MSRQIQPVQDNKDKQNTYRVLMGRYNGAVMHRFYFEALLIDYALLEDRLRSYLYHSGALNDRNSTKIACSKTKKDIKDIVCLYEKNPNLGISNIIGKIKIIKAIATWTGEVMLDENASDYKKVLKKQYESLDISGLLSCLQEISEWCTYRNEVIHAVMNKNMDSLYEHLEEKVVKGKELATYLDSQLRILKKGDRIRKKMKMSLM